MTTDEQYVPSEKAVRRAYTYYYDPATIRCPDTEQEFDRFLARVRRDAWTEGCRAAEQYYKRTVVGVPGSDPIPAPVNPHGVSSSHSTSKENR